MVLHRRNNLKAVVKNNGSVAVALVFEVGLGLALREDEKRQRKKMT